MPALLGTRHTKGHDKLLVVVILVVVDVVVAGAEVNAAALALNPDRGGGSGHP